MNYVPTPYYDAKQVAEHLREEIRHTNRVVQEAERVYQLRCDSYEKQERKMDLAAKRERLTTLRTLLQWLTGELWS